LSRKKQFTKLSSYGNQTAGENFEKAVNRQDFRFADYMWDEFKYSIIYGQMHRVASQYPHAEISFQFYDDRTDVSDSLASLYRNHQLLMPANLKLIFFTYDGNDLQLYDMREHHACDENHLQGHGVIDVRYSKNILLWVRCGGLDPAAAATCKGISEQITSAEALSKFKKQRMMTLLPAASFNLFPQAEERYHNVGAELASPGLSLSGTEACEK
jgi:hypothetical protein